MDYLDLEVLMVVLVERETEVSLVMMVYLVYQAEMELKENQALDFQVAQDQKDHLA